jgi:hypothetical protein
MKTNYLLASLLVVTCSLAAAAPSPPTPPPPPSGTPSPICQQGDDVLFQIESKLESPTFEVPTSRTTLYTTGAWARVDRDGKGKVTRSASGCVTKEQLAQVETQLAHTPWKVKQTAVACAAASATYGAYSSHGKVLWEQHTCQLTYLDKDSELALRTLESLLEDVSKPGWLDATHGKP